MNNFTEILKQPSIENYVVALIGIISTYLLIPKSVRLEATKERYEKLINPLFTILEPNIYKKIPLKDFHNIINLVQNNRNYADAKLLELTESFITAPTNNNYKKFCKYIDRTQLSYSAQLHLHWRSLSYRIKHEQYSNIIEFIFLCTLDGGKLAARILAIFFAYVVCLFLNQNLLENYFVLIYALSVLVMILISAYSIVLFCISFKKDTSGSPFS